MPYGRLCDINIGKDFLEVKKQMQEIGINPDEKTFEEICEWAAQHINIIDKSEKNE